MTEQADKTELELLKERARKLNIPFSNNIGLETLKQKVKEVLEPEEERDLSGLTQAERTKAIRKKLYEEQMKLVRIRISCLNPAKKELQGEIFTFVNRYLGTVRKYVPFGEASNNGYHVPYCIYEVLKNQRFNQINVRKSQTTGREVIDSKWVPEYAIEVLPQLTPAELKKLSSQQKNTYVD